jgi:hypothetical protein
MKNNKPIKRCSHGHRNTRVITIRGKDLRKGYEEILKSLEGYKTRTKDRYGNRK